MDKVLKKMLNKETAKVVARAGGKRNTSASRKKVADGARAVCKALRDRGLVKKYSVSVSKKLNPTEVVSAKMMGGQLKVDGEVFDFCHPLKA